MKNKEVIIFLVIALMVASPVVTADNLLTGFSFFDDVGNFFGNFFNSIKSAFTKDKVAGDISPFEPRRDEPEPMYDLTIEIDPQEGGDVDSEGGEYAQGSEVTLTATPNNEYKFKEWKSEEIEINEEDKNNPEITITTINQEMIIIANFEKREIYNININIVPEEKGEVEIRPSLGEEEEGYLEGTEIRLEAIPSRGYEFDGWGRDASENRNPLTITMDSDKRITAYFKEIKYKLDIIIEPEECEGRVIKNPNDGGSGYSLGTRVELTATFDENKGYAFKEWNEVPVLDDEVNPGVSGGTNAFNRLFGTNNPATITIVGDEEVIAHFNETICEDEIDNDNDGIIDSLDTDCEGRGLQITAIDFEDDEFWEHSKISIIDCSYEITPSINYRLVGDCMNLTIDGRKMECESKISQNYEDEEKGYVQFKGCDVGSESEDVKIVKCGAREICKGYPTPDSELTYKEIYVDKFNICEKPEDQEETELQKEKGENTFTIFEIEKPNEGNSFEIGGTIEIKAKVKNRFINEDDEQSSIEAKVEAVLVKTSTFEEIASATSEEIEIAWTHEKIFNLEIEMSEDLEGGNYRIYAKVYQSGNEENICRSKSIGINIGEESQDDETECETDEDEDGFCAEDEEDCNDEDPEINPEANEICDDGIDNNCDGRTDWADPGCETTPEAGDDDRDLDEDQRDETDEDSDGLQDWWEYNHFNNLNQGAYDDPDGDRIPNIDEFKFNTDPNTPNEKKSSLLTVLLIILGVVVVIAIIFFIIKAVKTKPRRPITTHSPNQNKIQRFVQQAKSQGMNKQQIKNALLNAGWKQQDINKFL